ncbi:unnamed protein product [Anisakis simplex]|uniref:Uncharacterized protein n=1 Tax=Anisakis simplex TaxID=6269 RepID=A0A3P6NPU9_ANISI|nr:unnamed protein product [Anisakis simplex]
MKELPAVPESAFERYASDLQRTSLYPNLNYSGLFYGIVNLLDVFPQLSAAQSGLFIVAICFFSVGLSAKLTTQL